MHFRNVHFCGRGRARGAVKARRASSHREVCDYKLDAGDMDCGGGDRRFRAASNAKNPGYPQRCSEFLGVAGREPL